MKRTDTGALGHQRRRGARRLPRPRHPADPGRRGQPAADRGRRGPRLGPRRRTRRTTWTTSVCTGSLVLGAAGLLEGKRATSHWAYRDELREFGAEPVAERVVVDGKVVTAAGVSAGIDMALHLTALEFGEELAQGHPARDRVRPRARRSTPARPRRPTPSSSSWSAPSPSSAPQLARAAVTCRTDSRNAVHDRGSECHGEGVDGHHADARDRKPGAVGVEN